MFHDVGPDREVWKELPGMKRGCRRKVVRAR